MIENRVILSDFRARWYITLIALVFSMPAISDQAPESISDVTVIDAEDLIDLVVEHEDTVVIDARLQSDYALGHIDGAINIPNTETSCRMLSRIVPGISHPIIFYCNGPNCLRRAESAKIARTCGYTRVYWFRGGFEEWLAKGYPYLKK